MPVLKINDCFIMESGHSGELIFTGCIVSDLLSHVIHRGRPGQVWVTHHGHPNVVAVSLLKEFAAVIIVAGFAVDPQTLIKARDNGLTLFRTNLEAYDVIKKISSQSDN